VTTMTTVNVLFAEGVPGFSVTEVNTRSAKAPVVLVGASDGTGVALGIGVGGEATRGTFEVSPETLIRPALLITQQRRVPAWITHHVVFALRPMICAVSFCFRTPIAVKAVPSPARTFTLAAVIWIEGWSELTGAEVAVGPVALFPDGEPPSVGIS